VEGTPLFGSQWKDDMRLKAKAEFTYGGKLWLKGELFNASEKDGLDLINQDLAEPYNLEDPGTTKRPDVADVDPLE